MLAKRHLIVGLSFLFPLLVSLAMAQQAKKPLSLQDVERLLRDKVSPEGVVRLLEERGVSFEVTVEIREKLKTAGADAGVMQSVEKVSVEFARRQGEAEKKKTEGSARQTVPRQIADLSLQLSQAETRSDWNTVIKLGEQVLKLDANHQPSHSSRGVRLAFLLFLVFGPHESQPAIYRPSFATPSPLSAAPLSPGGASERVAIYSVNLQMGYPLIEIVSPEEL